MNDFTKIVTVALVCFVFGFVAGILVNNRNARSLIDELDRENEQLSRGFEILRAETVSVGESLKGIRDEANSIGSGIGSAADEIGDIAAGIERSIRALEELTRYFERSKEIIADSIP